MGQGVVYLSPHSLQKLKVPGSLLIHLLICKVFPHLSPCSDWLCSLLHATFPKQGVM